MGWIGVDLFFVLSGFLVSGLLFKEYKRFGNIKPGLFLIRRGFKIYPIYYLFYPLYLVIKLLDHKFVLKGLLSDLFFVQNYVYEWSYAFPPSWSLAIEEHFYFIFAITLWLGFKWNILNLKNDSRHLKVYRFEIFITLFMILCLIMRIWHQINNPNDFVRAVSMTHLRIDSLLAGVIVSYWFHFKHETLSNFVLNNKKKLMIFSLLLVSFTPFINHLHSTFVQTIGFSLLFISFGILLLLFICDDNINIKLNKFLTVPIVNSISKIGYSSYSIYIIHSFIIYLVISINKLIFNEILNQFILFLFIFLLSILAGIVMTKYIEKYFLNIRDKLYPNRVS